MSQHDDTGDGAPLPADPKERAAALAKREAAKAAHSPAAEPAGSSLGDAVGEAVGDAVAELASEAPRCLLESLFESVGNAGCCLSEASFGLDCFVATATMGPQHPDLDALRAFRDRILRRSLAGRAFIAAYYRFGGHVARFIADKPGLKFVVREALVRPLARLARRLLRT